MEATITKKFTLEEPIKKVWAGLSNPVQISECVPGAKITEEVDEKNYKGEVTLKLGPVKSKYAGKITITEMDNENFKMTLNGLGRDSKGKGSAEMTMYGTAVTITEGTEVDFKMIVNIKGTLAQFGSRLINDVSAQLMAQFVDNFKAMLAEQEFDNTLDAGSVAGSVAGSIFQELLQKIANFFKNLFGGKN